MILNAFVWFSLAIQALAVLQHANGGVVMDQLKHAVKDLAKDKISQKFSRKNLTTIIGFAEGDQITGFNAPEQCAEFIVRNSRTTGYSHSVQRTVSKMKKRLETLQTTLDGQVSKLLQPVSSRGVTWYERRSQPAGVFLQIVIAALNPYKLRLEELENSQRGSEEIDEPMMDRLIANAKADADADHTAVNPPMLMLEEDAGTAKLTKALISLFPDGPDGTEHVRYITMFVQNFKFWTLWFTRENSIKWHQAFLQVVQRKVAKAHGVEALDNEAAAVYFAWSTCDGNSQLKKAAGLATLSESDKPQVERALDALERAQAGKQNLDEGYLKAAFFGAWSDECKVNMNVFVKPGNKPGKIIALLNAKSQQIAWNPGQSNRSMKFMHRVTKYLIKLNDEDDAKAYDRNEFATWTDVDFKNFDVALKCIAAKTSVNVCLYDRMIDVVVDLDENKKFQRNLASLTWVKPIHLDLSHLSDTALPSLQKAGNQLDKIDTEKSLHGKLMLVTKTMKDVTLAVFEGRPAAPGVRRQSVAADDILPALLYAVIQANPTNILSNVQLLKFGVTSTQQEYEINTLDHALEFLRTFDHAKAHVTKEDFHKNCQQELAIASLVEKSKTRKLTQQEVLDLINVTDDAKTAEIEGKIGQHENKRNFRTWAAEAKAAVVLSGDSSSVGDCGGPVIGNWIEIAEAQSDV